MSVSVIIAASSSSRSNARINRNEMKFGSKECFHGTGDHTLLVALKAMRLRAFSKNQVLRLTASYQLLLPNHQAVQVSMRPLWQL